jgi:hypothetical protein
MSDGKNPSVVKVLDEYLDFLGSLSKTVSEVRESMADGNEAKTQELSRCWNDHLRKASEIERKLRQAMLYDVTEIVDRQAGRNN